MDAPPGAGCRVLYDKEELRVQPGKPLDVGIVSELAFRYSLRQAPPAWPYAYKPWDCSRLIVGDGVIVDIFGQAPPATVLRLSRPRGPEPPTSPGGPVVEGSVAPGRSPLAPSSLPKVRFDVVVVGSGVSGLSAALAAAKAGARVGVIDFSDSIGGYTGGLWSPSEVDPSKSSAELASGLHSRLISDGGVRVMASSEYILRLPDGSLLVRTPEGYLALEAKALVMASGGVDARPVFPGNWLPGIVSSDYMLRLTSSYNIHFKSVAVVGWNDWALRVAGQLASKYADRVVLIAKDGLAKGLRYLDYASRYGVELVVDRVTSVKPGPEGLIVDFREYESIVADAIVSTIGPYPDIVTLAPLCRGFTYSETIKAIVPRFAENHSCGEGVFVAGLAAGEVSEYASYHGGALAGLGAAVYLGLADESDLKAALIDLMKDPQAADLLVEQRQGPQASPPAEPEMLVSPGVARAEFVDACAGVELAALEHYLRRFRDVRAAIEATGALKGLDSGREALPAIIQFSSMILGVSPALLPLETIVPAGAAAPLRLDEAMLIAGEV